MTIKLNRTLGQAIAETIENDLPESLLPIGALGCRPDTREALNAVKSALERFDCTLVVYSTDDELPRVAVVSDVEANEVMAWLCEYGILERCAEAV